MRALFFLIPVLVAAAGCSSDRLFRDEAKAVLKHIAAGYERGDPDEAISSYAPAFVGRDPRASAFLEEREERGVRTAFAPGKIDRAAQRRLIERDLARFERVERAKFVMETFEERDGGFDIVATFNLHGALKSGALHHELSHHRFFLEDDGHHLAVREHEVLDRRTEESQVRYFADRTREAGLDFEHASYVAIPKGTPVVPNHFLGSGASAGDIDGDGWLDLIVGDGYQTRLMRSLCNGTFEDITKAAGIERIGAVRGAYLVDLDNDRKLDIFLARVKARPALLRNLGNRRFTDVSERAFRGIAFNEATSAAFGDLDGDGDLDAYVVQYGDFDKSGWAWPIWNAVNGEPSVCLRNRGDGTFEEVADPVFEQLGWGLAVGMADYDDDGDPDIYVANDYGVNHLLRNDGGWKFTDVTAEAGVADQGYGMGVAWGDYDRDGRLDLYVTNMFSSSRWVFGDPNFPLPWIARVLFRSWVEEQMLQVTHGNSLFRNLGGGKFVEVTEDADCERADWAWGANFCDFDNDGDEDIYSPNGFISGIDEADQ